MASPLLRRGSTCGGDGKAPMMLDKIVITQDGSLTGEPMVPSVQLVRATLVPGEGAALRPGWIP